MKSLVALISTALVLTACSHLPDSEEASGKVQSEGETAAPSLEEDGDDGDEVTIDASSIPSNVQDAAKHAVPGLVITEAEKETEEGRLIYCVHGNAGGEFVEVEVASNGDVLEIERGDDDG